LNSNDKGLIYPNTTNTVQGLSGTHKSRVCEILAATALSKDRNANHGFVRSEEVENINVLYVDTERNLFDQLPYAVQQISRLATGNSFNKPANFDCLSLVGIPRNDRFSSLTEYISNFINTNTGHTLVILDVITDCLDDFNNVQSSLPLTDLMNRLCNQYDVTFVVVIHANPNSEKARGHLGTELINKSSCCLSLSLNQEVIELKCTKIRVGKKPDPLYYAYCDEEKHLVLTSQPDEAKKTGRGSAKAPLAGVAAFLEQLDPKKDYDKKEVTEDLMRVFGCGERTIDERLKSLRDTDQYLMHNSRPHTLVMEKRGKISFKPVHDDSQSQLPI
jgi:hypothetical protein